LVFLQLHTLKLATEEAAASVMDTASAQAVHLFRVRTQDVSVAAQTLAFSPTRATASVVCDEDRSVALIRATLDLWPIFDSIGQFQTHAP
jgi:hypothetical protein